VPDVMGLLVLEGKAAVPPAVEITKVETVV